MTMAATPTTTQARVAAFEAETGATVEHVAPTDADRVFVTIRHPRYATLTTSGADEAEAFAKMHGVLAARRAEAH